MELLRLRTDATLEVADGAVILLEGHIRMPFRGLEPALEHAVSTLAAGQVSEDALCDAAVEAGGTEALLKLQMLLRRLDATGWIERSVVDKDVTLARLKPVGHDIVPVTRPLGAEDEVALSAFAFLRVDDGETVLETPKASLRLVLDDPRLAGLVPKLAAPTTARALDLGLSADATLALLRLLHAGSLLTRPGDEDGFALAQWSFHELLMHARSRVGRNLGEYGGSYRLAQRFTPLPPTPPQFEPAVELARPVENWSGDAPFGTVLDGRRSIRDQDDAHPITVAQLGEFLYRAGRERDRFSDGRQELASRPYPGGGAVYELELYPLVRLCEGVEPGLYHYDAKAHALGQVAPPGPRTILLQEYSRLMAVKDEPSQILILVAARFGRVTWKYEQMAYALVLKHVGVLYQTMYLVATAMGLAPCALGGGNADAFAAASGLDYYAEPAVGEFLLGSRADTTSPQSTT